MYINILSGLLVSNSMFLIDLVVNFGIHANSYITTTQQLRPLS